jgi:hypothetical protein
MLALANILSIAESVLSVTDAAHGVAGVYELLTGTDGASAVLAKLDAMERSITSGLYDVVKAVNNETARADWRIRTQQLDEIQLAYRPILTSLATLTPEHTLEHDGMEITLVRWCETGTGTDVNSGALTILSTQMRRLADLFMTGGTAANPSLLDTWTALCTAAAVNRTSGFVGQTRYTLTFSLMQQVFGMMSVMVLAHEGALALYVQDRPENPDSPFKFRSIRSLVKQQFGDVRSPGTVWGTFGRYLDAAIAPAAPVVQYGACMTTPDNGPDAAAVSNSPVLGGQAYDIRDRFWVSTAGLVAPRDTYFSGVRLRVGTAYGVETSVRVIHGEPGPPAQYAATQPIVYPEVLPVRIGAGLVTTPGKWQGNRKAQAEFPIRDLKELASLPNRIEVTRNPALACFNTSYAEPPAVSGPDRYAVITGVRLALRPRNRIAVFVHYSTLDLSNPAKPSLTEIGWAAPPKRSDTFFGVGGAKDWPVDINAVDNRAAGTTNHFPASNATFVACNPTLSSTGDANHGTCIGLALQNALPLHRLTWLQPATVYGPRAAGSGGILHPGGVSAGRLG